MCDLLFGSPIPSFGSMIYSINCSFQTVLDMQINQNGEECTGSLRYLHVAQERVAAEQQLCRKQVTKDDLRNI